MYGKKIKLSWIRHGEHAEDNTLADIDKPLTSKGEQEVKSLRKEITSNQNTVGFSTDNYRSVQTTHLLVKGEAKHKIKALQNLTYGSLEDKEFNRALLQSLGREQVLRFLFTASDSFLEKTKFPISTYTTMAQTVAQHIRKYADIAKRYPKSLDMSRIFTAREYIYPCFRAKLLEIMYNRSTAEAYVDWYSQNKEFREESRTDVGTVSINGPEIYLQDSYGQESIPPSVINYLAQINTAEIRNGAYFLPQTKDGEYICVQYPNGKCGLIGGGVEVGEDMDQALLREVEEETGLAIEQETTSEIPRAYIFAMPSSVRTEFGDHFERHKIFTAKGFTNKDFIAQEQNLTLVSLPRKAFEDPELFPFQDFRDFVNNYVFGNF